MPNCIDVSRTQGIIDWNKVYQSGVRYAMIKATQGHGVGATTKNLFLFTDSQFTTNITKASNLGIKCGVYHYMTARTESEVDAEAEYLLSVIYPYKSRIKLWVALDVEDATYVGKLQKNLLTKLTKRFLDKIKAAGYYTMLYTNPNYLKYKFVANSFNGYDIWLAHYGVNKPMSVSNLKIWQYNAGRIDGINTQCDLNILYTQPAQKTEKISYKVGMKYKIKNGDIYSNGKIVPNYLVGREMTIASVMKDKILLKQICSWIMI